MSFLFPPKKPSEFWALSSVSVQSPRHSFRAGSFNSEAMCITSWRKTDRFSIGKHGKRRIWLVVEPCPFWKMMDFVSWDDEIPN